MPYALGVAAHDACAFAVFRDGFSVSDCYLAGQSYEMRLHLGIVHCSLSLKRQPGAQGSSCFFSIVLFRYLMTESTLE